MNDEKKIIIFFTQNSLVLKKKLLPLHPQSGNKPIERGLIR